MTLLFVDGFDDGLYALKWTSTAGTVGGTGRTGSRLQFSGNNGANLKSVAAADEHATMTCGFAFKNITGPLTDILKIMSDTAATTHVALHLNTANGFIVTRGAWTGTTLGTTSANVALPNVWNYVEIKVVLHDTTGSVELRVNGVTLLNLTGIDTKNAGTKTVLDSIRFGTFAGGTTFDMDDIYLCNGAGAVNNTFLGDVSIQTLYPNGDGASSQWVGSDGNSVNNSLLVDEAGTPSSADYTESGTATNIDTYAFDNLPATVATVKGVITSAYAAKSDAGAQLMRQTARIGGTNYPSAVDDSPSTSYAAFSRVMELSPATAAAWTAAEVNGAEFGVEAR